MEKLGKTVKRKWLKALRSGEIPQKTSELGQVKTGMCCLGVLAYVCGVPENLIKNRGSITQDLYNHSKYSLPASILNIEKGGQLSEKLIEFNDNKKWSFKKIATYIDRYL